MFTYTTKCSLQMLVNYSVRYDKYQCYCLNQQNIPGINSRYNQHLIMNKTEREYKEGERKDMKFMHVCAHTHVPKWLGHFQWKGKIKPSIKTEKLYQS